MGTKPKIHIDCFEEYRISVLRRIEWMLHRHFRDAKKIAMRDIKKAQLELNAYENFAYLDPAREKQIVVLDDDKIGTSKAEKSILEGKFFWEHAAAGEATRLGLGTKYLLELGKYSLEEIAVHIREEAFQELEKNGVKGKELAKEKKKIK